MSKGTFQSNHLNHYEYDADTNILVIEFTNGNSYQYNGVPFSTYFDLTHEPSPGSVYHKQIRGKFESVKLTSGDNKPGEVLKQGMTPEA